jgi:ATP-dependent exoDNAse (exonuclease V) alpha subunit
VLAGPAGAGKTTVLGILCAHPAIRSDGVLLLAPTGKARVRMQQLVEDHGSKALTIAQFLNQNGRYDTSSSRYIMSDRPPATGYGTVIIDESSMLTEDMLGSLFNALQGVKRFIFVGDPAQLPPIGAGRPFVDMIAKLRPTDYESRFPRIAAGYAELTIERRQVGTERPDLRLARWFSTTPPSAGEDDIFCSATADHSTIRFVEWQKSDDFQPKLIDVL